MTEKTFSRRELAAMVGAAAAVGAAATPAQAAQPHMENALNSLQYALSELNKALNNKGGHRVHAIEYTKAAIQETKNGINYAD